MEPLVIGYATAIGSSDIHRCEPGAWLTLCGVAPEVDGSVAEAVIIPTADDTMCASCADVLTDGYTPTGDLSIEFFPVKATTTQRAGKVTTTIGDVVGMQGEHKWYGVYVGQAHTLHVCDAERVTLCGRTGKLMFGFSDLKLTAEVCSACARKARKTLSNSTATPEPVNSVRKVKTMAQPKSHSYKDLLSKVEEPAAFTQRVRVALGLDKDDMWNAGRSANNSTGVLAKRASKTVSEVEEVLKAAAADKGTVTPEAAPTAPPATSTDNGPTEDEADLKGRAMFRQARLDSHEVPANSYRFLRDLLTPELAVQFDALLSDHLDKPADVIAKAAKSDESTAYLAALVEYEAEEAHEDVVTVWDALAATLYPASDEVPAGTDKAPVKVHEGTVMSKETQRLADVEGAYEIADAAADVFLEGIHLRIKGTEVARHVNRLNFRLRAKLRNSRNEIDWRAESAAAKEAKTRMLKRVATGLEGMSDEEKKELIGGFERQMQNQASHVQLTIVRALDAKDPSEIPAGYEEDVKIWHDVLEAEGVFEGMESDSKTEAVIKRYDLPRKTKQELDREKAAKKNQRAAVAKETGKTVREVAAAEGDVEEGTAAGALKKLDESLTRLGKDVGKNRLTPSELELAEDKLAAAQLAIALLHQSVSKARKEIAGAAAKPALEAAEISPWQATNEDPQA